MLLHTANVEATIRAFIEYLMSESVVEARVTSRKTNPIEEVALDFIEDTLRIDKNLVAVVVALLLIICEWKL